MIDAHVHVWRIGRPEVRWPGPAQAALYRDFTLDDLWAAAEGVEGVVLVQSQPDEGDTRWLIDQAAGDARVLGIVGWIDLAAPVAAARIDALAGPLVGIRPMVQDLGDDWYDDPAIDAGLDAMAARGLVLDALVRPRHLAALDRLAVRHPGLTIVVDHGAKPVPGDLAGWAAGLRAIATRANVACKLSGLVTELPGDAVPGAIATLRDLFGPARLVWGSDWPVVTERAGYSDWREMAAGALPAAERAAVFGGNARRLYRLERTA